jgi:hypothetical protein
MAFYAAENGNNKLVQYLENSQKRVMKTLFLESKTINESNDNKSESNHFDNALFKN